MCWHNVKNSFHYLKCKIGTSVNWKFGKRRMKNWKEKGLRRKSTVMVILIKLELDCNILVNYKIVNNTTISKFPLKFSFCVKKITDRWRGGQLSVAIGNGGKRPAQAHSFRCWRHRCRFNGQRTQWPLLICFECT